MPDKIAMVSGGFDPLHVGHVNLLAAARQHGLVIVALNSDDWVRRKKGYVFITWRDRAMILGALADVHQVISVDDLDGTVCQAIRKHLPHFFCNGGDRQREDRSVASILEARLCDSLQIERLYKVGGGKVASSSALVMAMQR
jgi:D-beta-D-heptose 7-phosphate kinase/D-beta-D-heptose 1-phosphate adenosyltransferase